MCGGTRRTPLANPTPAGLSPRVRGNHRQSGRLAVVRGSIPACAGEPIGEVERAAAYEVYPRVCGGTACPSCTRTVRGGLSPRVRGNPDRLFVLRVVPGSIPACAGEPIAVSLLSTFITVYPRVCGGTRCSCCPRPRLQGLSPRVRGNPSGALTPQTIGRSIPACAGEPVPANGSTLSSRVYPRVCGGTP